MTLVSYMQFLEVPILSIPYRYGITQKKFEEDIENAKKFQFLIGTVLQQYFRHFPALSSFFVSNLFKKSVDLTFLLSQISLKNQAFFKKIFFRLGRQTFLHFFKIFIAFSFVFSYFDCRFFQYFQGFQGRQTF